MVPVQTYKKGLECQKQEEEEEVEAEERNKTGKPDLSATGTFQREKQVLIGWSSASWSRTLQARTEKKCGLMRNFKERLNYCCYIFPSGVSNFYSVGLSVTLDV